MGHEWIILADSPGALVEFCGISILERLLRTLQRCGVTHVTVLTSTRELIAKELARPSWARAKVHFGIRERLPGPVMIEQIVDLSPKTAALLLVIPPDDFFDPGLLDVLVSQKEPVALVGSAVPAQLEALVASAPDTIRGKLSGP